MRGTDRDAAGVPQPHWAWGVAILVVSAVPAGDRPQAAVASAGLPCCNPPDHCGQARVVIPGTGLVALTAAWRPEGPADPALADFQTASRRLEEQSRELEAAQVDPVGGLPGEMPTHATNRAI